MQAHVQVNQLLGRWGSLSVCTLLKLGLCPNHMMVGMIVFLIEFYGGDKFLAFLALGIVWISEVFSIVA
jgi:hypothetical protein